MNEPPDPPIVLCNGCGEELEVFCVSIDTRCGRACVCGAARASLPACAPIAMRVRSRAARRRGRDIPSHPPAAQGSTTPPGPSARARPACAACMRDAARATARGAPPLRIARVRAGFRSACASARREGEGGAGITPTSTPPHVRTYVPTGCEVRRVQRRGAQQPLCIAYA